IKAARTIDLDVAGIDIVADDISRPLSQQHAAVIQVNAAPGLRMHLYPTEGQGRNVAADILDHMYPDGTPVSIPVISITGTNGKTTVTRMIQHTLSLTGKKIGMTCSSGTFIGKECIASGDNTGPLSARSVLYNQNVEIAVLETARGGIIRKGLGYDLADVGIIINISDDHLGLDGVSTLEEMAFVKSLVVEALKPDGYAVLNADDHLTENIIARVRCNLILFSQDRDNPLLEKHINEGETAIVLENDSIYLYKNSIRKTLLRVDQIPITFEGKAVFNIENSLAAMAGLFALGTEPNLIRTGLMSFMPDIFDNAGRLNLFDMGDFKILIDYGHNISGYNSVIQFAQKIDHERLTGVIGMPGDRIDDAIFEVGKISGQVFTKLYIKEDSNLRGRKPGAVAGILYHGALSAGALKENIAIISSEIEALETAINNAAEGDLIIMFYENFEAVCELVQNFIKQKVKPINLYPPVNADIPTYCPAEIMQ
ncbi:MAG: Mur ligase family protein, partial [Syntrophomonadaceae bacterium]|nr:Mur ligase family protein [Syntrophomonadaceae bacterium]